METAIMAVLVVACFAGLGWCLYQLSREDND
jgi:hypothetical protein